MKNVLLMRHAKSSWKGDSLPDHQRPLNQRGEHDAPRMGKFLQEQGILLEAILCSTAVRARETAAGLLKKYTFEGEVQYYDDLYKLAPRQSSPFSTGCQRKSTPPWSSVIIREWMTFWNWFVTSAGICPQPVWHT